MGPENSSAQVVDHEPSGVESQKEVAGEEAGRRGGEVVVVVVVEVEGGVEEVAVVAAAARERKSVRMFAPGGISACIRKIWERAVKIRRQGPWSGQR